MDGSIIFYIYDKCIELNGKQFSAGELTADFLNISSDEYYQMHRCMTPITELSEEYEKSKGKDRLWEINNNMEQLCNLLRRYTTFNVLLGEDEEIFFSVFRRLTEQYDLFSAAERTVSKSERLRQIKSLADKFFCREDDSSERVDLFAPHTTDDENKAAFFNELYRMLGVTGEAWSQYGCLHGVLFRCTNNSIGDSLLNSFVEPCFAAVDNDDLLCPCLFAEHSSHKPDRASSINYNSVSGLYPAIVYTEICSGKHIIHHNGFIFGQICREMLHAGICKLHTGVFCKAAFRAIGNSYASSILTYGAHSEHAGVAVPA